MEDNPRHFLPRWQGWAQLLASVALFFFFSLGLFTGARDLPALKLGLVQVGKNGINPKADSQNVPSQTWDPKFELSQFAGFKEVPSQTWGRRFLPIPRTSSSQT